MIRIQTTHRNLSYRNSQSGMALITVLFLLILMTILALTMVVSVNADMLINGYYGNARASYYAADSGMNIARQYVVNQLRASVNTTACIAWGTDAGTGCTSSPVDDTGAASSAKSNLLSTYGSFTQLNVGTAGHSWPSYFMIGDTATCTNSLVSAGSPAVTRNAANQVTSYTYTFNYNICAVGRASALQRSSVVESGAILLTVTAPANSLSPSFAAYGNFIQNYNLCDLPLNGGFFSGPQFSNGAFNFYQPLSYRFTDPVGAVNPQTGYWSAGGSCNRSSSTNYPGFNLVFQQGYNPGSQAKVLPPGSFSQKWAVIDGLGCGEGGTSCTSSTAPPDPSTVSPNAMTTYLKNVAGESYASNKTGVFFPYTSVSGTNTYGAGTPTGVGGGFYVEGDASIILQPGTDPCGNPTQIFKISQTSPPTTTTTITTNPPPLSTTTTCAGYSNTTTVTKVLGVNNTTTMTLSGVPDNVLTGSAVPSTMIYVHGTITGLSGPAQGQPAVQDNARINITGSGDIDITGDIIYKTEPVTLDTNDALVTLPASASDQVLGVFTATGNFLVGSTAGTKNMNIWTDGSYASVGASCATTSCGAKNLGSSTLNAWNGVGGSVQSNGFVMTVATNNSFFDRRYTSRSNFAPPWFPSTQVSEINPAAAPTVVVTPQRSSWAWIASQ